MGLRPLAVLVGLAMGQTAPDAPPWTRHGSLETSLTAFTVELKSAVENEPASEKSGAAGDSAKKLLDVATELGEDAQGLAPDKREAFIKENLGALNAAAGDFTSAEAAPPALARKVNNSAAHLNNQAGNWEEAKGFADKNLEKDPDDRDALVNRSKANYGLKLYDRSYADADHAAALDPDSVTAIGSRAMASYGLGNYLQAMEDARRALALDPNDRTAFSVMKLAEARVKPRVELAGLKTPEAALVQREYQGMIQQLTQVEQKRREPLTETAPAQVRRLIHGAAGKIALKDYWGAIADADKAIAHAPQNAEAYYYRAAADNLVGQYAQAVKDASQALALNPDHVAARDARSWAYYNLRRFNDAVSDANHSLEREPKNAYAYANRGYAYEGLGRASAMLADLKMAATLNPQFEPAYREAAAANHLEPEPGPAPAARRDPFLRVLLSSVTGGLLIAIGLFHIWGGRDAKKTVTTLRKTLSRRKPKNLDSSYELGRPIGRGGMGVVYDGFDRALKRRVAIKCLRPELQDDERERERFLQEARTVANLHHPAIVEIHSIVEDPAGLYLIFEFIDGKGVDALLVERKRLTLHEAKAILKPVCQALEFAHRHHVVHRDLKPSNIMVTDAGAVKVMDFGIARVAKDSMTKFSVTHDAIGTPHYMAPEQEAGVVRKESDIFSLGACLYEMLTGRCPYPATASLSAKAEGRYLKATEAVPSLPRELDALFARALEPDPDKRLRSPKEFWAFLERIKTPLAVS